MTHVIVVGAGYAGAMAANRLVAAREPNVAVTVVNPRPDFVERIRLHQRAAGSATAVRPLADVLRPEVGLRIANVDTIRERSVRLDDGERIDFDWLVYAAGSRPAPLPAGGHAFSVGDVDSATQLRQRLPELAAGARVVVAGGGLTGIEAAGEIAESFPDLTVEIVTDDFVSWLPERSRARLLQALGGLGVSVRSGVRVTGLAPDGVVTERGTVPSACTVWAGSFEPADLAVRSGLPVGAGGRLLTDPTLVCVTNPRIVGVGDAAIPEHPAYDYLRMSCQAAIPMGAHGADTVLALIRGDAPKPLSLGFVGRAVSLGRRNAFVQATDRADVPRRPGVRGRTAAVVKELVCRSTVSSIASFPGAVRWLAGPARTADERAAAGLR